MEDPFAFQAENSAHSGVTCGCSDEAEYCTQNDRRFHNGFPGNSIQRPYSSPFRTLFNSPVHHRNQLFRRSTRGSNLATGGSDYVHSVSSQKRVNLYKWYLIRVVKDCPQNDMINDEAQVAVGGYTTPDLLDCEKFRTAPIESRIEKCKLRTVDGLDVLLMGTIDELCTNDNGFPFQVIHLFLHGFPFNWNHVINISNGKPSLNMHILPSSKMKVCASKEKLEKPDSECPVVQVDDTVTDKTSLLEPEQSLYKAGSPRESSVGCSKRVRHKPQPARLSKRSICGKLSTGGKPEKLFTVVGSQEKSDILKESETNVSSGAPNKSVKQEAVSPHFKSSDMDSHVQIVQEDKLTVSGREFVESQNNSNILKGSEANLSSDAPNKSVENEAPRLKSSDTDSDVQIDQEDTLTDPGCELRKTKPLNFSVFHVGKDPVKTEKIVSQKYKSKDFKKHTDSGSSLDEAKLIESTGTVKKKEKNANQIVGKFTNSEGDADNRTDNQKVEQSSRNNVHLEQLIDNCTPVEEGPQIHISEFADTGCKRRRGRPVKSNTNSRNAYSQASRDILCDKGTMMDGINNNSDGKQLNDMTHCESCQEITPKRRRDKDPVKTEMNVSQRYKRTKESKKQIDSGSSLDEAKLVQSTGTVNIKDCNAIPTIGYFPDSEGDAENRADNQEIEQSSQNKVHLEESIDNCTPVEQTVEIHISVSEFAVTGSKRRRERPSKSNTKRNRNSRNAYSQDTRDIICDEATVMDGIKNNSDAKDMTHCEELHQEITLTSPLDKACKGTDERVHAEEETLADVGVVHFQKIFSSGSAENMPFSSGDSHINNDVIRVGKDVNKSKTKREGKGKSRTGDTNSICDVSKGLVCNDITMKDGLKLNPDDINEIENGDLNPEAKLVQSTGTLNIEDCNANSTIGRFPDSEGDADPRADNQEIEQSSQNKVHLEKLIDNCTPVEQTVEIQIPISEFAVTGSKRRRGRSSKSNTKRNINSRNAYSQESRDILCDEATVMDGIKNNSDVKDMTHCEELHQEITPISPLDKACKGTDKRVHAEEENLADVGLVHFQKNVSSGSAENMPFSSGDSHINNDVIRVRKDVNKSKTKRKGKGKSRTVDANPICDVSKGLVCNEMTMKDGLKLNLDDINEIANGDPNPVSGEIEHDMSAEHDTQIGDNFLKENVDKNKDSLQTQKNDTERTMGTPIGKRKNLHLKIPPPLPPRRVQTTPEEVSKAFGLKTSRSGRILVPPLAHWCNQAIAYDLDGGIIAIFDGSSEKKDNNGGCSFKPPKQAEAIQIQRKLCNAAKQVIRNPNVGRR